ncbi:MAG: hypothetical protein ACW98F_15350 [Candidatus Hodarchaeales archaeon]|jgi:hypothetical protein
MKISELDPILFRQHIKQKYSEFVWKAFLHRKKIEKVLDQEYFGSLNSVVQLFLQYVIKEWACPNCLQTILPFMANCYKNLPPKGDIVYVYSKELISKFPVLACPHCDTQIVVIAIDEYSDLFEFRYKEIENEIYDLSLDLVLAKEVAEEKGLVKRSL